MPAAFHRPYAWLLGSSLALVTLLALCSAWPNTAEAANLNAVEPAPSELSAVTLLRAAEGEQQPHELRETLTFGSTLTARVAEQDSHQQPEPPPLSFLLHALDADTGVPLRDRGRVRDPSRDDAGRHTRTRSAAPCGDRLPGRLCRLSFRLKERQVPHGWMPLGTLARRRAAFEDRCLANRDYSDSLLVG